MVQISLQILQNGAYRSFQCLPILQTKGKKVPAVKKGDMSQILVPTVKPLNPMSKPVALVNERKVRFQHPSMTIGEGLVTGPGRGCEPGAGPDTNRGQSKPPLASSPIAVVDKVTYRCTLVFDVRL